MQSASASRLIIRSVNSRVCYSRTTDPQKTNTLKFWQVIPFFSIFYFQNALFLLHNRNERVSFPEFRKKMFELACFNIHQIYTWQPDFDCNSLTRWVKKCYLIRLRLGYFVFPEYGNNP